jgi:large subunit ribosomal protein L1
MPNPKTGTVTFEVGKAVNEIKAGKVEFRVDKTGIIHAPCGKVQFEEKNLFENIKALIDAVVRAKPSSSKGKYIRSISLSSTMSPGIRIDESSLDLRN